MEDAHIAVLDLGNTADTAMFGVFDGHGGSEVAKFCQKYMAEEITKLQHYHEGRLSDSLVEVFHRIDLMLRDEAYSHELAYLKRPPDAATGEPADTSEVHVREMVSKADAMEMLKRVLAMRQQGGGLDPAQERQLLEDRPGGAADPALESVGMNGTAPDESHGGADENSSASTGTNMLGPSGSSPAEQGLPEHRIQAGCTAVVAVFQGSKLYVANAGDSRAVLCRGPDAVALSEDHKPASESERNRIMAAGGFISDVGGVIRVNGNLNLSRAIGDLRYKGNEQLAAADQIISAQPDITQITLTPRDWFLVLACDGVWDVMSNQEVVNFVATRLRQGQLSLREIASQLLDACLANDPRESRGIGCDNMTATIIVIHQSASALFNQA